jgi:hypothetical protein
MRNLFALFGAGTIAFVGLGWYLDWYKVSRQPAAAGTQRLSVDLNPDKITGDVRKGIERGGEIVDKLRENNGNTDAQANAATQTAQQGPATQFFSPPSATASQVSANGPWNSLDSPPPPPTSAAQIQPPRR